MKIPKLKREKKNIFLPNIVKDYRNIWVGGVDKFDYNSHI